MQVLGPLDSAFLRLEDERTSLHIASVAIFEGPPPSYDEFFEQLQGRLPLRYRQKICEAPFRLTRPIWVDDPRFDLRYHLSHTALPPPGTEEALRRLVGELMSTPLDRHRPLWETWVVEGLEGDRWALVSKVHHCMVDGITGTDLLTLLLDETPERHAALPRSAVPAREPSTLRLTLFRLGVWLRRPVVEIRAATQLLRHPGDLALESAKTVKGALGWARVLPPAVGSSLTGPLTTHRRWSWASTSSEDVANIRAALGGTLNDVILAAVTAGFRDLLRSRGEVPDRRAVRSLVPVTVRREDEHAATRVSAIVAQLPVDLGDPLERFMAVRAELDRLKRSGEAAAGAVLTELASYVSPGLLAAGLAAVFRLPQRNIVTVTTNVPGPSRTLYAAGRRLLAVFPYVPIADRVRIGVATTSYEGAITFGLTADYATTPDIEVLCAGIEEGMRELVKLASQATG